MYVNIKKIYRFILFYRNRL